MAVGELITELKRLAELHKYLCDKNSCGRNDEMIVATKEAYKSMAKKVKEAVE